MKKQVKDNALILIDKAQGDFYFTPDSDQDSRLLQAFILQASIIEGLLKESCISFNQPNNISGFDGPRAFTQAAREARVSGSVSKIQFEKIKKYIKFRNQIVHSILEKNHKANLADNITEHYQIGSEITVFLVKQ